MEYFTVTWHRVLREPVLMGITIRNRYALRRAKITCLINLEEENEINSHYFFFVSFYVNLRITIDVNNIECKAMMRYYQTFREARLSR